MLSNDDYIELVLNNFGLTMFVLAVFFIILHKLIVRGKVSGDEIVYRWMALLPLGVTSVYVGVIHLLYPDLSNAVLGWAQSPYQVEVGVADLAIGITAILSFNASLGFRLATVIVSTIFLLGCAVQHISLLLMQESIQLDHIASWLWLNDMVLPLVLFLCINSMCRAAKS